MATKNEVTFYNDDADCIVLTQTYADGHKRHTMFDTVSGMVNHLRDNGIDVAFEDIHTL